MSDELRAAVERFRNGKTYGQTEYRSIAEADSDTYRLANAYLAEHDPTPLTVEWLREQHVLMVGDYETGEMPDCGVKSVRVRGTEVSNEIGVVWFNGQWQVIMNDEERDSVLLIAVVETIGQFLTLCRGLGIDVMKG